MNKKIQKDPKPSKRRGLLLHPAFALLMHPVPRTTKGVGNPLKLPLQPYP